MNNSRIETTLLNNFLIDSAFLQVTSYKPFSVASTIGDKYCRNRGQYESEEKFRLTSCSACYGFMFPVEKELKSADIWLISVNGSQFEPMTRLVPDIHNETEKNKVCKTLGKDECHDWQKCCLSAEECCRKTFYTANELRNITSVKCPRTWDGYACWNDTTPSSYVSTKCPSFIQHSNPSSELPDPNLIINSIIIRNYISVDLMLGH